LLDHLADKMVTLSGRTVDIEKKARKTL